MIGYNPKPYSAHSELTIEVLELLPDSIAETGLGR
jgi:hypothetical protein